MKSYRLGLLDYAKSSWAIHDVTKPLRRQKNKEMPEVFYKFFSTPDAEVSLREPYRPLQCEECGAYETDKVFETGFVGLPTIRFPQDMGLTDDRVHVINDKCLAALREAQVEGFETTPLGDSGWHALRITRRVPMDESLIEKTKDKCKKCKRPDIAGAFIWNTNQISAPDHPNTFFTTTVGIPTDRNSDRDVFFTEGVLNALKQGKVKGPYCDLLLTPDDMTRVEAAKKQGKSWKPAGMTVYLSGK